MTAPTIETERLTLSAHRDDDLADCAAMWGDPAVTAHIGGRPATREETWQRLQRYVGHWQLRPYGYWLVRETATGRFIGEVGLMDSRRATEPSFEGTPEGGWALAAHAHGRGFAHEALAAMLGWADARLPRTVCIIDPANAPSLRLAEKLGYRLLTRAPYRDATTLLFERLAP